MARNDELPAGCARIRDDLSRFLDNDLNGRAATDVAAHLETCVGCRHEYDRLKTVRTALHALPAPSAAAMESARARAFARLENVVRAEEAATTAAAAAPRRAPFRLTSLFPAWRPAVATLAAAVVAGGLFFLIPGDGPLPANQTGVAEGAAAPLPNTDEMSVLFDLHDSRAAGMTAEDPMLHRSRAADAHAALLDRADAAASASL